MLIKIKLNYILFIIVLYIMNGISTDNFEEFYESFKDLNWDYEFLSQCNYITWNIVRNNLNKPWNLKLLSSNNIITFEMVEDTPFLRWDWDSLSENPKMSFDIIYKNIHYPWNFNILKNRFNEINYTTLLQQKENYIMNHQSILVSIPA